jgi:hypothetical protein
MRQRGFLSSPVLLGSMSAVVLLIVLSANQGIHVSLAKMSHVCRYFFRHENATPGAQHPSLTQEACSIVRMIINLVCLCEFGKDTVCIQIFDVGLVTV